MARFGRKIDTWKLTINLIEVQVPVYLRDKNFTAVAEGYDLVKQGSDLEQLEKEVREELKDRLTVAWEPYYQITYSGRRPRTDDDSWEDRDGLFNRSVECELDIREIEIGTKPDGSYCHRNKSKHGNYRADDGWPETGPDDRRSYSGARMVSVIPATEANQQALTQLHQAFLQLNEKLFDFLSPELITQSLAGAVGLLPAPAPAQVKPVRKQAAKKKAPKRRTR